MMGFLVSVTAFTILLCLVYFFFNMNSPYGAVLRCYYYLMVFPWSLSDSKSPQISRTLPSIPVDLMILLSGYSLLVLFLSLYPSFRDCFKHTN